MPQRRIRLPGASHRAKIGEREPAVAALQPLAAQHWNTSPGIRSALLLGFIFLIVLPAPPFPLGTGLDSSWAIGLNMGHFERMSFGRDIIFTYGPLGYLIAPAFPQAEPWAAFAFPWALALATGYALWTLCKRAAHWTEIGLYLGVFWVCSGFIYDAAVERMLAAILALTLVIAAGLETEPWFDLGLLFLVAAIALLSKFNIGVIGSAVAFYFAACLLWRRRARWRLIVKPVATAILVWLFTLVGLYWILDGAPGGLPAFLRNSVEIAAGYSEAMAWAGPLWWAVVAVASLLLLWIAIPLATGEIRRVGWGIPPLFIVGFLCFKSAAVRQDTHVVPFPFEMAAAALLMVALASTPRSRIVVAVFAAACLDWGAYTVTEMWPQSLPGNMERLTGRAALTNLDAFLHWRTTVSALQAATEQAMASDLLPADFLPYVKVKTVSAYPWEIATIRANHLRWRPLPVFQAYSAYTPTLDLLDAQNLKDASAPEAIVLAWGSIDGRHPFYEAPGTWRALLDWYDLQLASPNVFLLRRRSTPRFDAPVAAGGPVPAYWDRKIALPSVADDEALLMDAQIEESVRGLIKRTLLRSPAVYVHATLRSGLTTTGRVVRPNLRDGVLATDYPRRLTDLAAMLTEGGAFSPDRVASLSFSTQEPADFKPTIRIQWSRIKLRQAAGSGHVPVL